eukprot:CAMPEP_0183729750 /NCGR_PEP_ID=MMETSP0737-20130205/31126_1 /TAXON_ID=385413 /ORGANISM="Thalassiosira miniscula, Strain CCMP1093" /LENGTH=224 /DNA_ID=CAMNT_0025962029 /DNA_START=139 /DNA_END=813 /DNA_ORIENTATION=+
MNVFQLSVSCVLLVAAASGFQIRSTNSYIGAPSHQLSLQPTQRNQQSRTNKHLSILHQSSNQEEGQEEEEYELVEFFVSPEQITTLRKEATKRDSRKKLTKFFMPPPDDVSDETIDEICKLFDTSELIEVRGVSKDNKRRVFDTAHALAGKLEDTIEKPVVVVDIKGFAVKLYCPWDDEARSGRIQLRTGYKPGQWTRKAKPIRDNRGQIILDEHGKSVKEMPE